MARHARLADELRLPAYRWYTPLWAAAAAVLAGRFAEAEALTADALEAGTRAGDRNAEIFTGMIGFVGQLQRDAFAEIDLPFIEDRVANSPAGPAYRGSYCWILAGLGDHERARHELAEVVAYPHAFDANWLSAQVECAEAALLLDDRTHAATLAERLAPYAGRPVTAARAVVSYGAVDRTLGGLAALLGRRDDAVRHLHTAIRRNDELGCTVWRLRAQQRLQRITPGDPLVAGAEAEAAALGLAAVSSPRSPRDPRPSPAGAG
jgi:hypothetical protein